MAVLSAESLPRNAPSTAVSDLQPWTRLIVPTLRVGTQPATLCAAGGHQLAVGALERPGRHYRAECESEQ